MLLAGIACHPTQEKQPKVGIQKVKKIHFDWENVSTDPLTPLNDIYLIVNDYRYQISKTLICERIHRSEYEEFSIPATAVDACGGWWAGNGAYFYINSQQKGGYTIYSGEAADKGPSNSFDYELLMSVDKQGVWKPKIDLATLSGVYTLNGLGESWVMVLESHDNQWRLGFAHLNDLLPARTRLPEVYLDNDPMLIENFQLNPFMLTFESDLGKGHFKVTENDVECIFEEQKGNGLSQLKLLKEKI